MISSPLPSSPAASYELRFQSLFHEGRGYAFPCDARGHVHVDALSARARHNYFHARAAVGREYAVPAVWASTED
jgi:hypothetical protein